MFNLNGQSPRVLFAAGLAVRMAANQAACLKVNQQQKASIAACMCATDIRQVLGHPDNAEQFRSETEPTWTSGLTNSSGMSIITKQDSGSTE